MNEKMAIRKFTRGKEMVRRETIMLGALLGLVGWLTPVQAQLLQLGGKNRDFRT